MNKVHTPKVSVIMPAYNAEKYLRPAVDSILKQTFKDFEFLIMDDGSADGTADILDEYARKDGRVKIVHQANAGVKLSLTRLLMAAKGEYIARQDADDISMPQRLSSEVEYLDANQCVSVVSTGVVQFDDAFGPIVGIIYPDRHDYYAHELGVRHANPIVHGAVMFRRSAVLGLGGLLYRSPLFEDYDLWLRMLLRGHRFGTVEKPLYFYRIGSSLQSSVAVAKRRKAHGRMVERAVAEGWFFDDERMERQYAEIIPLSAGEDEKEAAKFFSNAAVVRIMRIAFMNRQTRSSFRWKGLRNELKQIRFARDFLRAMLYLSIGLMPLGVSKLFYNANARRRSSNGMRCLFYDELLSYVKVISGGAM